MLTSFVIIVLSIVSIVISIKWYFDIQKYKKMLDDRDKYYVELHAKWVKRVEKYKD